MVATMVRVGMRLPSPSSTAVEVADLVPTPVLTSMPFILSRLVAYSARSAGKVGRVQVGILDEINVDLLVLDVRIIFQRAVNQIVDLGDGLNAGEPGAYHNEGEQLALQLRLRGNVSHFQAADHVGAQAVRIREVLHGERVLGQAGETIEIDAHAERNDELVVGKVERGRDGSPARRSPSSCRSTRCP